MADLPTRADLFRTGENATLAAPGNPFTQAMIETEGSDINVLLGAGSGMANEVVRQVAIAERSLFLDTATGEELDRLAFDHYGITRKDASPATGQVTFSRPGAGAAGTIPVGFRVQSVEKQKIGGTEIITPGPIFQTTQPAAFATSTTTVTVPVESLVAARGQGARAGRVIATVDAPFDTTITVTNAAAIAGGADAEDDATFRERVRRFWLVVERGTLAALEFGALLVPGVAKATAIELLDPNGDPARVVRLFVSDADGASSQTMVDAVEAKLKGDPTATDPLDRGWRAAGINVVVLGGTPVSVPITWKLSFAAGVDTLVASGQVRAATVAFVNSLSPGQTLFVSDLMAIAKSIAGVIVPSDAVQAPVGDLVPQPGEVIRTTEAAVTFL